MISEEDKILQIYSIAAYCLIALGTAIGALYYVNTCPGQGDIKEYIDSFIYTLQNDIDRKGIMIHSIRLNAVTILVFMCCAFFRLGVVFIAAESVRRGFISGFTTASFISIYGVRGIILSVCMLTSHLLLILIICNFAALNAAFSLKKIVFEKRSAIFYTIFSIITITIFCGISVCEGYITTTFMRVVVKMFT